MPVSYTHLRAHETVLDLVCRLLLEKKNKINNWMYIRQQEHRRTVAAQQHEVFDQRVVKLDIATHPIANHRHANRNTEPHDMPRRAPAVEDEVDVGAVAQPDRARRGRRVERRPRRVDPRGRNIKRPQPGDLVPHRVGVAVPPDRQPRFGKYGYHEAIISGHALEGNLHFVCTQDFGNDTEVHRYRDFMDEVVKLVMLLKIASLARGRSGVRPLIRGDGGVVREG